MRQSANSKPRDTFQQCWVVFFTQALGWGMSHRTHPNKFEGATRLIIIAATLLSTAAPHADTITDPMDPSVNISVDLISDDGTTLEFQIFNNSTGGSSYNIVEILLKVAGFAGNESTTQPGWIATYQVAGYDVDDDGTDDDVVKVTSPAAFLNLITGENLNIRYDTNYKGRAEGYIYITTQGTGSFAGPLTAMLPVPLELNLATTTSNANEGTTPTITASLNAQTAVDITFDVAVTGGNATAPDYTLTQTSFTIPKGSSSVDIPIQLTDSDGYEGPEELELTLQNASASLGSNITHTLTINDTDIPTAVWVDPQAPTNGIGTLASPLNDLLQGLNLVEVGGTVHIHPGDNALTMSIAKPLTLQAVTTNVNIGTPAK